MAQRERKLGNRLRECKRTRSGSDYLIVHKKQKAGSPFRFMLSAAALLSVLLAGRPANGQHSSAGRGSAISIPAGTILPARLNSSLSSSKSKPRQIISATIMQDVPLPGGEKIRRGSKVRGHIVAVSPATTTSLTSVSLQFDTLLASGQAIPIVTNLRALAGFVEVLEAQTPVTAPGESDVYRWLTTVQVGGDVVYGEEGPVASHKNSAEIIGKSVPYGVLVRVSAKEGTQCRGPVDGNDSPQALWVFSSDACGVYGVQHVEIAHAGRTNPTGVITLSSDNNHLSVRSGAGMLLRVDRSAQSTP
jgi:hypothetical protein